MDSILKQTPHQRVHQQLMRPQRVHQQRMYQQLMHLKRVRQQTHQRLDPLMDPCAPR